MSEVRAEKFNYWKTGNTRPEIWVDKIKKELEKAGAKHIDTAVINSSKSFSIVLRFVFDDDNFCINWKALDCRPGNEDAAKIQAATMLHHDIKSKCHGCKRVKGSRKAFFEYLVLPDGQIASEVGTHQLPKFLEASNRLK